MTFTPQTIGDLIKQPAPRKLFKGTEEKIAAIHRALEESEKTADIGRSDITEKAKAVGVGGSTGYVLGRIADKYNKNIQEAARYDPIEFRLSPNGKLRHLYTGGAKLLEGNTKHLQNGDIILYGDPRSSSFWRGFTSPNQHTLLYHKGKTLEPFEGRPSVSVDADWLDDLKGTTARVYRHPSMTPERAEAIAATAKDLAKRNSLYSEATTLRDRIKRTALDSLGLTGVAVNKMPLNAGKPTNMMCSSLVAEAYRQHGIGILPSNRPLTDIISTHPSDLANNKLNLVGTLGAKPSYAKQRKAIASPEYRDEFNKNMQFRGLFANEYFTRAGLLDRKKRTLHKTIKAMFPRGPDIPTKTQRTKEVFRLLADEVLRGKAILPRAGRVGGAGVAGLGLLAGIRSLLSPKNQ